MQIKKCIPLKIYYRFMGTAFFGRSLFYKNNLKGSYKVETKNVKFHKFEISGKYISVYLTALPDRPVIYLNTFGDEGESAFEALKSIDCPEFTLVTITGLDWNRDMTPWSAPSIFKNDDNYTGGADDFLRLLTGRIIPEAEKYVIGKVLWRGLAGYSLAGLFAVYSMYQVSAFSKIASVSGSLWFPGIKEYIMSHKTKIKPDRVYLSIGDMECRSSNNYLKTVQDNTEEIAAFYKKSGFDTVFQINPGNHFKESSKRTAAGIAGILLT